LTAARAAPIPPGFEAIDRATRVAFEQLAGRLRPMIREAMR
jgi:hypothetical protein